MSATAPTRAWFAFSGLLAGAAGVATSVGIAWGVHASTNPVLAVASEVRDNTPGSLAQKLIHAVGHADKPLLVTGTVVILVLLCALAGLLARWQPLAAVAVFVALAVIGLLAVLDQPHSDGGALLSLAVGFVTWLAALPLLTGALERRPAPDASRRQFVAIAGGVAVVGAGVLAGGRWISRGRRAVEQARELLRLSITEGTEPSGADLGVAGVAPWRTPDNAFYRIDTAFVAPAVRPSDWQLRVHGMVDREITLTYDDLARRRLTEAWVTLCCVSNEVGGNLIGNAHWSGVLIRDVLAEAGVQQGADAVKQTSYDGWTCGTPLSALTDPHRNAMLAIGMNGQPLPIDHGFPVRMVVPGLYGFVSATKWVVDLEVTAFDRFQAYWTREGWSPKGPVKTESRIDVPRDGRTVPAGSVRVGGSAWAQHTGISAVEFQLDGGPWQRADLGRVPDDDTWVQWAGRVQVAHGDHELRVRATDKSGYTQTPVRVGVVPNGATGWDSVKFSAT